jgi:hypothetical protein
MKYSDIKRSVLANFSKSNKLVPFILGKSGGGKSSLAREIIAELNIEPNRITEFNLSLRDPVDILGLPRTEGQHSSWLPPSEFWRIRDDGSERPCALIIEEITDASIPMQNPAALKQTLRDLRRLKNPNPGRDFVGQGARRHTHVVLGLQVHPEPRRHVKKQAKPQCRVRSDRPISVDQVADAAR